MRIWRKRYLDWFKRIRMNNLLNSGTILKKKQSTMPKNFKMRNFMLQVIGLKCGRLDVCFKVIAAEEKAVTPEMTISW